MKIIQQLEQLGFKQWDNTLYPEFHSSWQLRVRGKWVSACNSGNTLYFVNVNLTDYNTVPFSSQFPTDWKEDLKPEYEVQFNNEHGTFNVDYFGNGKGVEEALEFYKEVFVNMKCFDYDD